MIISLNIDLPLFSLLSSPLTHGREVRASGSASQNSELPSHLSYPQLLALCPQESLTLVFSLVDFFFLSSSFHNHIDFISEISNSLLLYLLLSYF